MEKSKQFRKLLSSDELTLIMEAYNGISAKIVEAAGFQCVWASGLAISASMGMRDCDELTATQTLNIAEYIADATTLPVLFDGDTGYGDFNSVRLLVRKLCKLGIVGVALEDMKVKTSSYAGEKTVNDLEDIKKYCAKIKAAQDTKSDPNFAVIARIHALVCHSSMEQAVERAVASKEAGADAVFIHSTKHTAEEIFAFSNIWHNELKYTLPLIATPLSYFATPLEELQRAKISMAIIAGYNIRASVKAMQNMSQRIRKGELLADLENEVTSLKEIFQMVNYDELLAAEKNYLA